MSTREEVRFLGRLIIQEDEQKGMIVVKVLVGRWFEGWLKFPGRLK